MNNKVVIIGCGNVGISYAYALINQKTNVREIVLIDLDEQRVEGEVMDLNHGSSFGGSKISVYKGTYQDCKDAKIVCISAGVNQKPGETRLELLKRNEEIFKSIISKTIQSGFDGIFLIATNPVDIMSYVTYKHSGFDSKKIIGTGTTLDTARLRYLIGEEININTKNIHAYVLGEHGDSEFVSWSNALVGNVKIEKYISREVLSEIENNVKYAAYEIIKRKGATYYAIGMVLVRITNAILGDENTILTVSCYDSEKDIYIGMPAVVNKSGIDSKIPLELSKEELALYNNSANILKEQIDKLN